MSTFTVPYPDGLPIGEGWADCPDHQKIVFPYDGSLVADSPVGSVDHARRAMDAAAAVRGEMAALSTGARRALLMAIHSAFGRTRPRAHRAADPGNRQAARRLQHRTG